MIRAWLSGRRAWLQSWKRDPHLARILRNSSFLFASYAIGAFLTILTARLLGVADFGILGIVTVFVTNINRLFSFRMGEVVVRYMGEALAQQNRARASAVVKAAFLAEAGTSVIAFVILIFLAPVGAAYFAKDPSSVSLFLLYGISILFNVISESSLGVLQVTNHYKSQALINFAQAVLVAALLGLAAVYKADIFTVTIIYLIGKAILGVGPALVAFYWLPRELGDDWGKLSFTALPPIREMIRFSINTNFNGTVTMLARDSEIPIVSFFFGAAGAGYYKIALALINMVVQPINPFISTTYPEITRLCATQDWSRLRSLLRRVTIIAAAWTGAVTVGLILFGRPLLFAPWHLFGRTINLLSEYAPAYPLVLILMVGYGAANIFFWNRPLLLAQGQAAYPFRVSLLALVVKLLLTILLLPKAGIWGAAGLLSGYLLSTVALIAWRGLRGIRQSQAVHLQEGAA